MLLVVSGFLDDSRAKLSIQMREEVRKCSHYFLLRAKKEDVDGMEIQGWRGT